MLFYFDWFLGSIEGGQVFEQSITVSDDEGHLSQIRRIQIVLEETTRDGDSEIFILTNLSPTVATGLSIAQIYRYRWTIETLFQILTDIFNCEIKTFGYPKARLKNRHLERAGPNKLLALFF